MDENVRNLKTFFSLNKNDDGVDLELQVNTVDNKLYVDGKEVVTREVVQFRLIELVAIWLTAIGVFVQAIMSIVSYFLA